MEGLLLAKNAPSPAKIVRLYRMMLRHAGASVLYARPAIFNLRALYRPEFDVWMTRAKAGRHELEKSQDEWEEFARRGKQALK